MRTLDEILHTIGTEPRGEPPPLRLELDLVGLAEAAELLGIGRAALGERRKRLLAYLRDRTYLAAENRDGISAQPLNAVSAAYDRATLLKHLRHWEADNGRDPGLRID